MIKVGLIHDSFFQQHDTGGHPEQPARLVAIDEQLRSSGFLDEVTQIEPEAAQIQDILRAHHQHVIDRVHEIGEKGGGYLDSDTIVSAKSGRGSRASSRWIDNSRARNYGRLPRPRSLFSAATRTPRRKSKIDRFLSLQ